MKRILTAILLLSSALLAQNALFPMPPITTVTTIGNKTLVSPVPNATITVCTSSGTGLPCAPHATIYADASGTSTYSNPFVTDGYGNLPNVYLPAGIYVVSVQGSGISTTNYTVPVGMPCDGSGNCSAKSIEQVRYADQYGGADAGAKISACLSDLPATGGICDATGLNGAQTWSEDVLSAAVGPFVLRLGAGTTTVSHAQTIAQPATISGQGSSTILSYTPVAGTFLTWEYGSTSGVATNVNVGMRDLRILGPGRSNLGVVAMQFGPSSGTATAYGMTFYDVAIQDFDTVFLLQDNAYFIDFFKLYTENTGTVLKVPASGITNSGEHVAFIGSILSDGGVAVNWQAANGDLFMTDVSLDYDSGIDGSGSVLGDVYMTASAGTFHGMHLESSAPHDFIHAIGTATVSVDGWNGVSTVVAAQGSLSAARTSNSVTVTYPGGSLPYASEPITVGGCSDSSFDGNFVVSSATSTTITYPQTAANATATGCTVAVNWSEFFNVGGSAWGSIKGGQANMAGGRLSQILYSNTSGYVTQYQNQPLQVAGTVGDGVVTGYNGPTNNTPLSFNAVSNRIDIGATNIWFNGVVNFNGNFGTNAKFPYGNSLNFGNVSGNDSYIAGNASGYFSLRDAVNGLAIRNNADTRNNFLFDDAGNLTASYGVINAFGLQQGGVNAALQGVDINSSNQVVATHAATLNGATTVAAAGRFKLADQGQCTMASGTCTAQSLGSTYATAPVCIATWTGTGTLAGTIKVSSTTTTVTPSSTTGTDTAQVNWACFGN